MVCFPFIGTLLYNLIWNHSFTLNKTHESQSCSFCLSKFVEGILVAACQYRIAYHQTVVRVYVELLNLKLLKICLHYSSFQWIIEEEKKQKQKQKTANGKIEWVASFTLNKKYQQFGSNSSNESWPIDEYSACKRIISVCVQTYSDQWVTYCNLVWKFPNDMRWMLWYVWRNEELVLILAQEDNWCEHVWCATIC